jgi:hypothetical protein
MGNLGSGIPRSYGKERSHADSRITQRRPSSPSTGWRYRPESVVAIRRNAWSSSIGMTGRDQSESLVVISRCAQSGAESSSGQARAEGGGGFLRVGQKRQLAFHAGVLSARRRAIPFVSRIGAGEIRRKHDLIAHGAAALSRRTEKNDKGKFGQS